MRVLICGGKKTINIVNSLAKRFVSGSVEITMQNEISGLESFINRGDYFDKAIIIEQSWTNDGEEQDEIQIRDNISAFVTTYKQKCLKDSTCIFVAATEKMARIAAEESLEINSSTAVVLKETPYTVSFFTTIITSDIQSLPESCLFKLENVDDGANGNDDEQTTVSDYGERLEPTSDIELDLDINTQENITDGHADTAQTQDEEEFGNISDFDSDIFGDNGILNEDSSDSNEPNYLNDIDSEDSQEGDSNYKSDDDIETDGLDTLEDTETEETEVYDDNEELEDDSSIDMYDTAEAGNEQESEDMEEIEILEEQGEDSETLTNTNTATDTQDSPDEQNHQELIHEIFDLHNIEEQRPTKIEKPDSELNSRDKQQTKRSRVENTTIPQGFTADEYKNKSKKSIAPILSTPVHEPDMGQIHQDGKAQSKKLGKSNKALAENTDQLIAILNTFAMKGSSIVVTGAEGAGTSTIAFNMAKTLNRLGYTVLIVDMDTYGRAQSFISMDSYEAVHSHNTANASLKLAINDSNSGIGRYVNIIDTGLHVLTMGLAGDILQTLELADKSKLTKLVNAARNNYNFTIYDMPFNTAINYAEDIVCASDNIVITMESSNHGIMRTLINMCNIDNADVQEILFKRAQLCLTKYLGINKVLGKKAKALGDILYSMDVLVIELLGLEPEYRFKEMQVCKVMNYDARYEEGWFSNTQYSDYEDGYMDILTLIKNILLKDKG